MLIFLRLSTATAGVDFTNISLKAFMRVDPKRAKNTDSLTVFFLLLGFANIKAALTKLVKSIPDQQNRDVISVEYKKMTKNNIS